MFSRMLIPVHNGKSFSTTSKNNFKVMIAGAAGGIGQPLALLLKLYPLVTQLAMYDISPATPGVTEDLHHVNTSSKVKAYMGAKNLSAAMKGAHVVVIPAGTPSKPGMNRDELFGVNSSIVRDLAIAIAKNSPKAIVAIITNPVNSMVPICSEVLKKAGVYDPRRIFGVTTLDVVRASVFVGEINGVDPSTVSVPIIGGHSGVTIIPVLSQSKPLVKIIKDQAKVKELTKKIQEAGPQVVIAKAGTGSSTLSMAYAAARLTNSILRGLNGESNVVECTYVKSDLTASPYFSSPILLGKNGVEKQLGYGKLTAYEQELLKIAIPALLKNIKTAEDYVKKHG